MALHKTLLVALLAVVATLGAPRGTVLVSAQPIKSVRQLHQAYHEIFPSQNRNAASHKWIAHVVDRAKEMSAAQVETALTGFCAVSGSPVNPSDYNRYQLELEHAAGHRVKVYMHYCCWPCVCDVQDFVKIDTMDVETKDGVVSMHFAVIGDPCEHPEKLKEPFVQPFDGRYTTLERDAPELKCGADGRLKGALYSDHGHVVIGGVFGAEKVQPTESSARLGLGGAPPGGEGSGGNDRDDGDDGEVAVAPAASSLVGGGKPGRVSHGAGGVLFQSEGEYAEHCAERESRGHDSGMGEIFRRAAGVTPIKQSPDRRHLMQLPAGHR